MPLTIQPLTTDRWPALEELFSQGGPVSRCWCMYWRIGAAYRRRPPEENRAAFRALVEEGPPPGLLAFDGERVVGWCQLTLRHDLPWLDRRRRLPAVGVAPVWSLSCFYIRKGHRRRGVSAALIAAAIEAARDAGAAALEAYPLDPALTPSSSSTGFVSTFARAGFRVVTSDNPARPVMRYLFEG